MSVNSGRASSLFRTHAWVDSWVDVWGKDSRISLIDLGGRGNSLEMLYSTKHQLKGIIPVESLVVAGYGFADFKPPRAEYNSLASFINLAGDTALLGNELKKLRWNQFALTDFCYAEVPIMTSHSLAATQHALLIQSKSESAYRIKAINFADYKQQLSGSTRARYFNRRSKLTAYGELELIDVEIQTFFDTLNQFHIKRWRQPCYSSQSMRFLRLFIERIQQEGGHPILQLMQVAGESVSAIFDIVWDDVRYNLQSGYLEHRFPQMALGSIHLGFAIEQAIQNGQSYDMLAGTGKNSNYKEKIATECVQMETHLIVRGWLKHLYSIYGKHTEPSSGR